MDVINFEQARTKANRGIEGCMVGDVDSWPVVDLLLWLNKAGRSGMIRVGEGLEAGVAFFANGFLFRCEYDGLRGTQAVAAMLAINSGTFRVIQRDVPRPRPNVHQDTEELIMSLVIASDEGHQDIPA